MNNGEYIGTIRVGDSIYPVKNVDFQFDPSSMELSPTVEYHKFDGSDFKYKGTFECEITEHGKEVFREIARDFQRYTNEMLRQTSRIHRAKNKCKIHRRQTRAAFRRLKRGKV